MAQTLHQVLIPVQKESDDVEDGEGTVGTVYGGQAEFMRDGRVLAEVVVTMMNGRETMLEGARGTVGGLLAV